MEFLIVLLIIFVLFNVTKQFHQDKKHDDKIAVRIKECPPHIWFWQEVVDQNGNKVGERIVCKRCGPLSKSLGETNE